VEIFYFKFILHIFAKRYMLRSVLRLDMYCVSFKNVSICFELFYPMNELVCTLRLK